MCAYLFHGLSVLGPEIIQLRFLLCTIQIFIKSNFPPGVYPNEMLIGSSSLVSSFSINVYFLDN